MDSALARGALIALITIGAGASAQRPAGSKPIPLRRGLVITRSERIAPGHYRIAADSSLDSALVTIRGENVTVDFAGVTLEGGDPTANPDEARGVAIRIDGGRNIRLRNATIRGYKVAILARGTRGLELTGNNVSHNWKPRLFSVPEHESLVDWLSFHHNENDEWLRFGAAIYLSDVHGGVVRGTTAEQGMNGLLLVRSDSLRVEDNDFSFNSGLGVGLYRSSWNTIVHNRIDYDVRGYSHGRYRRGQDSAGLLMYEQSTHNVAAFNSVTHGGDGLFLWAGQSTMDTGAGGANDNLFYRNDFSFAPTNGMEATFSRNTFLANYIAGSDYGLWGGYSFESRVIGNCFVGNRIGIAIEHGQDNTIVANRFDGDSLGIRLWADSIQPSDWGYPKHRDTRSRDYRITGNVFSEKAEWIRLANTASADTTGNLRRAAGETPCVPAVPPEFVSLTPTLTPNHRPIPSRDVARRDRSAIVIDEWGPFDWRSPKLWPIDSTRAVPLRLVVLGPAGRWGIVEEHGIAMVSERRGRVGDTILVAPKADAMNDWSLALQYVGAETITSRGERKPAGTPVVIGYQRFEPTMQWNVRVFAWTDDSDPRTHPVEFEKLLTSAPIVTRSESRLDYMWYRPTINGVPQAKFTIAADASVTLAPGTYTIRAISDDAVRVWVDDTLVINDFVPHESRVQTAALSGGQHTVRVVHYQVDGWTELRVEIVRGLQRSTGSAGPH